MKADRQDYIERVWRRFAQRRDRRLRNLLLKHYLQHVKYTAERLHARLPASVELEDLINTGALGLLKAICRFQPGRGVKFETYCSRRIEGAMLDALRKTDWIPRLVRQKARKLEQAAGRLEALLGRRPTEEELADELGLDKDAFYQFLKEANAATLISLSREFAGSDGENDFKEIDGIADRKSPSPVIEAQKRDLKAFMGQGLSRQEQLILTLYHQEEMTMKEIGLALGISESRVSQIHTSIIARLKDRLRRQSCLDHLIPERKG